MRLTSMLFAAALTAIAAETVTTPIDNDQVKVLNVMQQPHEATKRHRHAVNRVMIYLQPGTQSFDHDGKKSVLKWKAGDVKWSPADGMHVAEITSDNPVNIIEIELKKPGGHDSDPGALDPVKLAPKMYKVEFENDQVRVLRVRVGAHQATPLHEHTRGLVVVFLTDQQNRITTADGKVRTSTHKAGDVAWAGNTKHREENIGDKPFEVLAVEIKN